LEFKTELNSRAVTSGPTEVGASKEGKAKIQKYIHSQRWWKSWGQVSSTPPDQLVIPATEAIRCQAGSECAVCIPQTGKETDLELLKRKTVASLG